MQQIIDSLLILQDRDRQLYRLRSELAHVPQQRQMLLQKDKSAREALEAARQRVKELETRRKELDLEVQAKQEQIERYANQQLQTRKNEEYQALAREIENTKAAIARIEDQELELMEQGEAAQKDVQRAAAEAEAARKLVEAEVATLDERERNLKKEFEELQAEREKLAAAVDESVRNRYERLLANKGQNVVVGIHKGVCGGCHMKLPAQELVACKQCEELVTCPNCGRILYYTRDMSLVHED